MFDKEIQRKIDESKLDKKINNEYKLNSISNCILINKEYIYNFKQLFLYEEILQYLEKWQIKSIMI